MDGYEDSRRKFLRKLGLTFGVTMASTGAFSAVVTDQKDEASLSDEQREFMIQYEKWMDEFIQVIAVQRIKPEDDENNRKLIMLSQQAKSWQGKLVNYMKDDAFAAYYMVATQRMTNEIS